MFGGTPACSLIRERLSSAHCDVLYCVWKRQLHLQQTSRQFCIKTLFTILSFFKRLLCAFFTAERNHNNLNPPVKFICFPSECTLCCQVYVMSVIVSNISSCMLPRVTFPCRINILCCLLDIYLSIYLSVYPQVGFARLELLCNAEHPWRQSSGACSLHKLGQIHARTVWFLIESQACLHSYLRETERIIKLRSGELFSSFLPLQESSMLKHFVLFNFFVKTVTWNKFTLNWPHN